MYRYFFPYIHENKLYFRFSLSQDYHGSFNIPSELYEPFTKDKFHILNQCDIKSLSYYKNGKWVKAINEVFQEIIDGNRDGIWDEVRDGFSLTVKPPPSSCKRSWDELITGYENFNKEYINEFF